MNTPLEEQQPNETREEFQRVMLRWKPPTAEQLANLAAPLLQRHKGDAQAALAEAEALWAEAVSRVRTAGKPDVWKCIKKPAKFPLDFDGLLFNLMPKVPNADRLPRFKAYLAAIPNKSGGKAVDVIAQLDRWRREPIHAPYYRTLARAFNLWWEKELSEKRKSARASR